MTHARVAKGVAAAVLLLVALSACAADGDDPSTAPTSPTSEASPSRSPQPTSAPSSPPSQTETAAADASALVRRYYSVVDALRQGDSAPISRIGSVASSTQLTAMRNLLQTQRADGFTQMGNTEVVELSVESINLEGTPTALVDVCWDVSAVDVVNRNGKSIIDATRPDSGWTRLTVTNSKWKASPRKGWRVSGGSDLEKPSCAGS